MKQEDATPIFVIGKHRSGTTGLANHLCEHTDVAGVQHEAHWGIHESGYYPYVVDRYGSLDCWPNFRAFVEVMNASDYFRLAGIEKEYMLSLYPTSYAGFFKAAMDEFARRRGVRYWLEKTPEHTKYAPRLAHTFSSARFVAIIRNVEAVIASSLAQLSSPLESTHPLTLTRLVSGWVYYTKTIFRLNSRFPQRTVIVRYDNFRDKPSAILRKVCANLGIDYDDQMTTVPYAHNTSFPNESSRRALQPRHETLIALLSGMLQKVPHVTFRSLDQLARALRSTPNLPDWFFKLSDRDLRSSSVEVP